MMERTDQEAENAWVCQQNEQYQLVHPRYAAYAEVLHQILEKAVRQAAPLAIIQTRPKTFPSFAEKAIRKKNKYRDPLVRMTDLCGGRVIAQTLTEVKAVCAFIELHFIVDAENSVDVSERLKPSEFGYRSVHYIVQLRRGVFPSKEIAVDIPEELYPDDATPMKAEIQVRTVLEHAWAGFGHDRVYKSAYSIPPKWKRELAVLAGMLEQTDQAFTRIQSGLRTYAASYGAYLNEEQLQDEIAILESVLSCDERNPELAHRIGKLAMELGDWQKAIDIFSRFVEAGYQPIVRDLGVALCKVHSKDPYGEPYRQGQRYLEMASSAPNRDSDALASLAGTWKKLDESKARDLYRQAFEVDPTDQYAVSNYLVYEIIHQRDLAPASLMAPTLTAAVHRCRDQAEVGMNIPWAFYNLGMFHLLLRTPYDSMAAYAKAIQLSNTDWMIETSLRLLEKLSVVQEILEGYDWARKLLMLGLAVKFGDKPSLEQMQNLATPSAQRISGPVVIVAGGTRDDNQNSENRQLLLDGFRGFHGTVIGGGTIAGVSGLVGELQAVHSADISTIGYVPRLIPAGVELDRRYCDLRSTAGAGFSALEPLQYWIDIVASGISPSDVRLIGVNGGEIAALEYRLALALGAQIGLVETSGREAARLFRDPDWASSQNLWKLAADKKAIQSFIQP